jgi:AcrR family transcriptional regulator
LVRTAAAEFAKTGLHATTTEALARAAGISQPVLYLHFANKEALFREAVQRNSNARANAVERRIGSIGVAEIPEWIEHATTAIVTVCLSADGGPMLMNWALLELPEFGADLHRQELGEVAATWEREISLRTHKGRGLLPMPEIYCAVQTCYSYAFWLGALRHTHVSAAALVRQFAGGAAELARALEQAAARRSG